MMCEKCKDCNIDSVCVSSSDEYKKMFNEDSDYQYGCICPKCKKIVCCECV